MLIANDEPMQLQILEVIFQQLDFEVDTAINGMEAFKKVKQSTVDGSQNSEYHSYIVEVH